MGKQDKRKYAYKLGRFSKPPQSMTLTKLLKIRSLECSYEWRSECSYEQSSEYSYEWS